jgi:choloylglycine hydrolase
MPPNAVSIIGRLIKEMRSSTIWTTANDTKNKVIYYHTQHNRQVRKIDVGRIGFSTFKEIQIFPLDVEKAQMIVDRTPQN